MVPGVPWQAPVVSFHVPLQDSTTKFTLDGAVVVPVYVAFESRTVPVLPTVKNCGANDGLDVLPLFLKVSTRAPVPPEASVVIVATAPQRALPTPWEADVALAVLAAAAAAIDMHTSRAAAAKAAPALPGYVRTFTRLSFLWWWRCAGIP